MKKISDDDLEMVDADARFILANERTLLAWVRTSLTILAGGIAFAHFNDRTRPVLVIGVCITLLGAFTAFAALKRFNDADHAIRTGKLPLTGKGPALQVGLVWLFAAAIIIVEIVQFN